jgi:ATP-dependent helicase/DNAse subunit B
VNNGKCNKRFLTTTGTVMILIQPVKSRKENIKTYAAASDTSICPVPPVRETAACDEDVIIL